MMENKISSSNQLQQKVFSADKLPPPEVLLEYEHIMPGITKLLVDNADRQMQHRQDIERRTMIINNLKSFAGLIFGFLIGIFGMGGGFYLTFKGYNVIGIIFSSSTLVSLVMTFIYGSQSKRNGNHRNEELLNRP